MQRYLNPSPWDWSSDNPMEMDSNDIKGEPEENTGDEGQEKAEHGTEMSKNCLRVSSADEKCCVTV